jgi:hypothetical protein
MPSSWRVQSTSRTSFPRTTASWTAALPTLPEAPLMSSVLPFPTPSWSSARVAVSIAADGDVGNALAELVDDARRLVAHGLRQLPIHRALALLPVARVDAGRAHRNPDLAGTRMRIGELHDLEDLRAPEPIETDRLHQ